MQNPIEHPLFQKLLNLELPPEDYAVFGSAPMWLYGLKDLTHDIDILSRGKAWERAQTLGPVALAELGINQVVTLFEGEIEIFDGWFPGQWDVDVLIDSAIVVQGIRFISLPDVLSWKLRFGREKDLQHAKLIAEFLNGSQKSL